MRRDFSHLTAREHEEMRQNDCSGEHGRWEDAGAEHEEKMAEVEIHRSLAVRVVYEVERDRHGLMFSGPLEVGECVRVVLVDDDAAVIVQGRARRLEAMHCAVRAILDAWDEFEGIEPQLIINALAPHVERARSVLAAPASTEETES